MVNLIKLQVKAISILRLILNLQALYIAFESYDHVLKLLMPYILFTLNFVITDRKRFNKINGIRMRSVNSET